MPRSASSPPAPPSGRSAAATSTSCPSRAPPAGSASATPRSSAPGSPPATCTTRGPASRAPQRPTRRTAGPSSNATWPPSPEPRCPRMRGGSTTRTCSQRHSCPSPGTGLGRAPVPVRENPVVDRPRLLVGSPVDLADVQLAELLDDHHPAATGPGDDLRGLNGTAQRGRVDRGGGVLPGQPPRPGSGLSHAQPPEGIGHDPVPQPAGML